MKRNKFSLSHYKLTSLDMGYLYPVACYEVLPGDTIQHATSALMRCTPLATPPMHPVSVKVHHWYVPTRIIWDDFEDFITGGDYGSTPPVSPFSFSDSIDGFGAGSLQDYFGLPINVKNLPYSTLPLRAYAKVFNENYRDQDLTSEVPISYASGLDVTTNAVTQWSNWDKDYFTQARPWPQKSPDISIPINDAAVYSTGSTVTLRTQPTGQDRTLFTATTDPMSNGQGALGLSGGIANASTISFGSNTGLSALTSQSGGTINQLREAFALQRYAEARARYGSRYTEYLRYLGINSSDARLQRPEYLGGGKSTMQFSEVLQTGPSSQDGSQIVGEMFGHGIASIRSNRFRRFFEEHGYVITIMQIMPKPMYSQGVDKMWSRVSREDYYQKELEHIGQQPITNGEIYAVDGLQPENGETWGYTNRYQEYRGMRSSVAAAFRPGAVYDDWHFSRAFADQPVLNDAFLRGPVTKRPFADQNDATLLTMCRHSIQARRMMSKTAQAYVY